MTRIARVVVPGIPHHVVQRGVRSMDVFRSDDDREMYLSLILEYSQRYGLEFWVWCLMTNHVHFLAVPAREDSLALALGQAHRIYAKRINESEDVRGHLFQERFYSYPVQLDSHFLAVARYIELNPVTAGIIEEPHVYPWSSARHHLMGKPDRLVKTSPIKPMVADWQSFLHDGVVAALSREEIERHLRTGRPLGEDAWVERIENAAGRKLSANRTGRPTKS